MGVRKLSCKMRNKKSAVKKLVKSLRKLPRDNFNFSLETLTKKNNLLLHAHPKPSVEINSIYR